MFKKVLVDLETVIEMPQPWYFPRDMEARAKLLEEDAKELTAFIRDHRSRDSYAIEVRRKYKSLCSFCGMEEERDTDGTPVCCSSAISEYNATRVTAEKQP